MLKNTLLAASLASMLAGIASPQAHAETGAPFYGAADLTCAQMHFFVGDSGRKEYVVSTDVVHDEGRWTIRHHMSSGAVYSRGDQYNVNDVGGNGWQGTRLTNPRLAMAGELLRYQGHVFYSEAVFHDGNLVGHTTQDCGPEMRAPAPAPVVTASAPAPVTAPGGDVVGLVSNGNAAAVKVHFGARDVMMLIDTGASSMSLTPDIANALLQAGEAHYTGQMVQLTLANGSTASEQEIVIDRVSIGSHSALNVHATITAADGMPLLPFPVLNQMGKFTIDTRNNLLIFG